MRAEREARVASQEVLARPRGGRASSFSRLGVGWEGSALLVLALVLFSLGLVMVYSASAVLAQTRGLPDYHFVVRQALGGLAGIATLIVLARLDYAWLRGLAWPFLGAVMLLLLVVVLPGTEAIAPEVNGGRRWLVVGPVNLQPSELAKVALILWTAALAVKKQELLPSLSQGLLPFLVIWGFVVLLIFLEPNLSAALLVLLLAALVVFAGGARIGHFLLLGVVGLPLLWSQVESVAYRLRRVLAFVDPSHDAAGTSYQINQSLISLGSGGVFGRGFGQGQQKFGFLPEPHTDFLFAMIGEEWGFAGAAALVLLYGAFALVGYRIARHAPDRFGFLLAVGLTNLIVVQALLHMAVNMALLPTTGVTLPFLSYGRSSLLACLASVGVLMSVAHAADRSRA
ncbi:MAG: putative lipid II flippase FtsW [Gemmatimonadetes bacterium]|nr:putative lipid II flippase FtsW [Gemmatimonadota bacterium]